MAKTNNKGFTLIEIIIAVAILSVLLTPVIKQYAATMETSRKAKALQEVNEMAAGEMEEFQTVSKEELDKKYGAPSINKNVAVTLYDVSGTEIANDLTYSTYQYNLEDSLIGAKRDKYSNVVVLDDLSNKVRAYGGETAGVHYKVAYGLTKTELAAFGDGFELTNEGSIVKYDDEGYVVAVACTDTNANGTPVSYVQNPNDVNLGNMQNLDKNNVALVLGGTSSFDSEAFSALFSKAMDHLRVLDYESWQQALLNVDNESILSQDSMNNSKRLIKIYTDQKTDASGKDYYIVKVDVYYDYNYSLIVDGEAKNSYHDMINYTVFSQKFYTKEVPAVYFEYQPYCISGADTADAVYQSDDYILFDNHVDESKVYLYKPYKDQQNAAASLDDYYTVDTDGDGEPDAKATYYTYYTDKTESQKVTIHLASKQDNVSVDVDKDKKELKPVSPTAYKRVYLFTNLDKTGYYDGNADAQFVSDGFTGVFDYVKGENETRSDVDDEMSASYTKFPLGNSFVLNLPDDYDSSQSKYDSSVPESELNIPLNKMKVLYSLSEDTREAERLYTVTVKMTPEKNSLNTVRLSGAKGAN